MHHALAFSLGAAQRPLDEIAHAVHHADADGGLLLQKDLRGLAGHELGLGGHDGLAGAALRQLIQQPILFWPRLHVRQHQLLHEAGNEGALPRPYRPYHANIDVPIRPLRYIPVQTKGCPLFHGSPSLLRLP